MDRGGCPREVGNVGKSAFRKPRARGRVLETGRKSSRPMPPRKAASEPVVCPYRKPTQVGRGTAPQVDERTSVKELGKLTPYLRKKGCPSSQWLGDKRRMRGPQ